jgi:DNA-binding transcriptional LysR family regulator
VTATPAGLAFAAEARRVLAALETAVAEAHRADGIRSTVRIGVLPVLSFEDLQRFLSGVSAREPSLRPVVTHLGSLEQIRRLHSGELDFAILHLAVPYRGIEVEQLFEGEPVVALLPTDHPLVSVSKPQIEPEDVADQSLVGFSRSLNPAVYDWWLSTIEQLGYRFRDVYEVNSHDLRDVILAVACGSGISLVSAAQMAGFETCGIVTCRPLANELSLPPMGVAWRARGARKHRQLVDTVREVAQEIRAAQG